MQKLAVGCVKIGASVAILGYLVVRAANDQAFARLWSRQKDWELLLLAALVAALAVMVTHVRWYYLVRLLGLPFRLTDALRLGFLGYFFNFLPIGIVGGDLLKAVLLGRQSGRRAKALASVLVDRVLGLYMLFVLASAAVLATAFWRHYPAARAVCMLTFLVTAVGALALAALFTPWVPWGRFAGLAGRFPSVGQGLVRVVEAIRMYRQNVPMLLVTSAMGVGANALFVFATYLVACGLFDHVPSFGTQLVIVPVSTTMGVIPLAAGPFEAVLEFLYCRVGMPENQGFIVALGFRIITLLVAAVGLSYYLASRQEVSAGLNEAQAADQPEGVPVAVA